MFIRWSQIQDHGTSHFCIVDADRNAVSMTTTVNYPFGAGILSLATGIVLNNEMADFSVPTEISLDSLPPSPTNFISPNKRPLSSMTPIIIVKVVEIKKSFLEYTNHNLYLTFQSQTKKLSELNFANIALKSFMSTRIRTH